MKTIKKILTYFSFLLSISHFLFSFSLKAYAEDDPKILVEEKYKEIQKITSSTKSRKGLEKRISKVMDSFVDYTELSRQTLIQFWDKLKKQEKNEFVNEFKKLIQKTYVRRFKPQTNITISYRGETVFKNGKAMVKTTVHREKSEVNVDYIFHKKTNWLAYDVIIDGVSMMKNYRKQFHNIMKKENFQALISKIKKKVSEK